MNISLIFANDINGGIGKDGKLPWPHSPKDSTWMKHITRNHILVMGSKTWNSLPPNWVGKMNGVYSVVIGNSVEGAPDMVIRGTVTINNIMATLKDVAEKEGKEIMVFGGKTVYDMFLPFVSTIYMTTFQDEYDSDVAIDRDEYLKRMDYCVYRNDDSEDVIFEIFQSGELDDETRERLENIF